MTSTHSHVHRPDSLLRCGHQFHSARGSQVLETPQYALVYFIDGHGSYEANGHVYNINPGTVIQRYPSYRHTLHFHSTCESHYAAIPAPAFELMRHFKLPSMETPVFHIGIQKSLIDRFKQISKELRSRIPQHQIDVAGHILQLFIDVHQHVNEINSQAGNQRFIRDACNLLQEDFSYQIDLPRIAERLGVSYPSFRKRFTQLMGISPGAFRIQQRIEHAKHYLLDQQSVTDVAELLGYPDCYSFSKQFKKIHGQTPSAFKHSQGL